MSSEQQQGFSSVDNSPDSTDRKKATHLRCERQRREAINNGYQELKELLPASFMPVGCKTTNAAILFRASDYLSELKKELDECKKNVTEMEAQKDALKMVAGQYENMIGNSEHSFSEVNSSAHFKVIEALLDSTFASFTQNVDTNSFEQLTQTLIPWVEMLNFEKIRQDMLDAAYKNN